jgi:hypothetical protein
MLVGILQQHASNLRPRGAFLRRFAAPSHQPGDHVVTRYLAPVDDEHCYDGTAASRYQASSLEALPEGVEAPELWEGDEKQVEFEAGLSSCGLMPWWDESHRSAHIPKNSPSMPPNISSDVRGNFNRILG